MPTTNSITLLNICRVIEQTPDEGLLAIDRDALAATTKALKFLLGRMGGLFGRSTAP